MLSQVSDYFLFFDCEMKTSISNDKSNKRQITSKRRKEREKTNENKFRFSCTLTVPYINETDLDYYRSLSVFSPFFCPTDKE